MMTSQRSRWVGSGSPVRLALRRSVRALRDLHDEQVYAWERYFQSCRAPQPGTHAPAEARSSGADPGARSAVPVGAGSAARTD